MQMPVALTCFITVSFSALSTGAAGVVIHSNALNAKVAGSSWWTTRPSSVAVRPVIEHPRARLSRYVVGEFALRNSVNEEFCVFGSPVYAVLVYSRSWIDRRGYSILRRLVTFNDCLIGVPERDRFVGSIVRQRAWVTQIFNIDFLAVALIEE